MRLIGKSLTESIYNSIKAPIKLNEDHQIWSNVGNIEYYSNLSREEMIQELKDNGWDEEEINGEPILNASDEDIREYLTPYDLDLDAEDYEQTIEPMIEDQCYGDILVLSGISANWRGSAEACKAMKVSDLRDFVMPNYEATIRMYCDKDDNLYYTESNHDTPMGGTEMYLYAFLDETDYNNAGKYMQEWLDDEEFDMSYFEEYADYKEVAELIKSGILKNVKRNPQYVGRVDESFKPRKRKLKEATDEDMQKLKTELRSRSEDLGIALSDEDLDSLANKIKADGFFISNDIFTDSSDEYEWEQINMFLDSEIRKFKGVKESVDLESLGDYELDDYADKLQQELKSVYNDDSVNALRFEILDLLNKKERANKRASGNGLKHNKKLKELIKKAESILNESTLKERYFPGGEEQYFCNSCGLAFDEDQLTGTDDEGNDLCPACGSKDIVDTGKPMDESLNEAKKPKKEKKDEKRVIMQQGNVTCFKENDSKYLVFENESDNEKEYKDQESAMQDFMGRVGIDPSNELKEGVVEYDLYGDKVILDTNNKKMNINGKDFSFEKMDEFSKMARGANRIHKPMSLLLYTDFKNGRLNRWNQHKVNNSQE